MKQAIVVFHGMGDQTPMATLNSLADAVWVQDEDLVGGERMSSSTGERTQENEVWSKPDSRNRSYELYRLTTGSDKNKRRTDFYEFYWAHHVNGTTWEQVKTWIFDLMLRRRDRVPTHVAGVWKFMWLVVVIALGLVAGATYLKTHTGPLENAFFEFLRGYLPAISVVISAVVAWFISSVMVKRVGDVVRYTKQKPENISIRQTIRDAGVQLLEELNDPKSKYDRIIIVAHSLGTIVAYDILTQAFARCNTKLDFRKTYEQAKTQFKDEPEKLAAFTHQAALNALELFLEETTSELRAGRKANLNLEKFKAHQRAAQKELVDYGCPWNVTDFITLGSPLTHAEFLMADGELNLRAAQTKRQFPTCPPVQEFEGTTDRFRLSYDARKIFRGLKGEPRIPNHGSVFAFTRWTNIYSPRKGLLRGDVVSGPVSHLFGQPVKERGREIWHRLSGISDIPVLPERDTDGDPLLGHKVPFLTHNNYWNLNAETGAPAGEVKLVPHHIRALRDALNLLEE